MPNSSLVEIDVDVGVVVGFEVGVGVEVRVGSLRWVVGDEVEGKLTSKWAGVGGWSNGE